MFETNVCHIFQTCQKVQHMLASVFVWWRSNLWVDGWVWFWSRQKLVPCVGAVGWTHHQIDCFWWTLPWCIQLLHGVALSFPRLQISDSPVSAFPDSPGEIGFPTASEVHMCGECLTANCTPFPGVPLLKAETPHLSGWHWWMLTPLHSYKTFAQWIIHLRIKTFLTKTWQRKVEHAPPPTSCAHRITFLSACRGFQATVVEASSLLLNFWLIKVGQIPFITAYFKWPSTQP